MSKAMSAWNKKSNKLNELEMHCGLPQTDGNDQIKIFRINWTFFDFVYSKFQYDA